jgi:hypothetical protein
MKWILAVFAAGIPMMGSAAIFKCPDAQGNILFSDRPCDGALESESESNRIEVEGASTLPVAAGAEQAVMAEKKWEEAHRYHLVDVPQLRVQAAQLIATGDPQKVELGRQLMYQLERSEEAYGELKRAREAQEATKRRYDDALRQLRN